MNLNDLKRRTTATPSPLIKRTETGYHADSKLDCPTPPPLPLSAPHSVERTPRPASLSVRRLSPQFLAQLANARIDAFRGQGRRVVGLPVLLIILNWVRHSLQSHKADDVPSTIGETSSARLLAHGNKLRLPSISSSGGSSASAVHAVVVDSDDVTREPSLSRIDAPTTKRGASSDEDPMNYSDSHIEMFSSENKVEGDQDRPPHSSVVDVSDSISSGSSSNRALANEEDTAVSPVLRSDDADATTSESESDGGCEEVDDAEDIDSSRAPHAKPPSLSSLQPIRESLIKRKPRDGPEHDVPPKRTIVASGASEKQRKERFHEEAPAIRLQERGRSRLLCF